MRYVTYVYKLVYQHVVYVVGRGFAVFIMGQLDASQLQDGFIALILQADPLHLSTFFIWLDLKVAQFKITGHFVPGKLYYSF